MMDKLNTFWWAYVWGPALEFSWWAKCLLRGYHLSVPTGTFARTPMGLQRISTHRPERWVCVRCFRIVPRPDRYERMRFTRATRSFKFPTPPRFG